MKRTKSTYLPELAGGALAKIDAALAAIPVSGKIDTLNWVEQYPAAPETTFTLANPASLKFRATSSPTWKQSAQIPGPMTASNSDG